MSDGELAPTVARPRVTVRDLTLAFALASVGALGTLPGSRTGADPIALLVWLSICALPLGFFAGGAQLRAWPLAAVIPAAWMGLLAFVDGGAPRDVPSPAWAALAWTGLFAAGFGIGRLAERARWSGAAALLCASGCLALIPIGGGLLDTPWSPRVSARLLDLSPTTLVAECAGLDWMRHPALYAAAGTADIDPALRSAWRGSLAGPIAFLLGCCIAVAGDRAARARR